MKKLVSLTCATLLCAAMGTAMASGSSPLSGTSWMLDMPKDSECEVPPMLEFGDAKVNGDLGCNKFFADVKIEGKNITFDHAGMTKKMCAKAFMEIERKMVDGINQTKTFEVTKDALRFFDASGKEVLKLLPEKAGSCE